MSSLPDLTDQHFKDIGVLSLGHRLQLLRAIAELPNRERDAPKVAVASVSPETDAPIIAKPVAPPAEAAGERRHVTVMFCDLVDSTGIASKLDPEKWRDLVGAYVEAASRAITEMGGKVAKKLGDGVMALISLRVRSSPARRR